MRKTKKKKLEKPVILEQWIEITRENGKTLATPYPPNKELERLRQEMDPPPVLVYRRLNFVHGVPREYEWTDPTDEIRAWGGMFLLRISIPDWLHVMNTERVMRALGNQNLAFPQTGYRRPAANGPCSCAECTKERESAAAD